MPRSSGHASCRRYFCGSVYDSDIGYPVCLEVGEGRLQQLLLLTPPLLLLLPLPAALLPPPVVHVLPFACRV